MPMISVALDEDVYRKAEERAAALRTSVPEVVAHYLRYWAVQGHDLEGARRSLADRFAQPQQPFSVGTPDDWACRSTRSASTAHAYAEMGHEYFEKIKRIWAPFSPRRIIPFCTPFVIRPNVLVIGTNHSDFVRGGGTQAESIADSLASSLPTVSTFLDHAHTFAEGLRKVCERAGVVVDQRWMGTNRCAVQTGPDGLKELESDHRFKHCQDRMDRLLIRLVTDIVPRNVVLAGNYAAALFYSQGDGITKLRMMDVPVGTGETVRVIPIPHWSRARFWSEAAQRLREDLIV